MAPSIRGRTRRSPRGARGGAGRSGKPAFAEYRPNQGMDLSARPWPYLMVPLGGYQRVYCCSMDCDVRELEFVVSPASRVHVQRRVDVTQRPATHMFIQELWISGRSAGPAWLEVRRKTAPSYSAVLELSVKPRKVVKIQFKWVWDKSGRLDPRRPQSQAQEIFKIASAIYAPQTNIVLQYLGLSTAFLADEEIGAVMRYSDATPPPRWDKWGVIAKYTEPDADFNVFFVREVEYGRGSGDGVDGVTSGKVIFIEDRLTAKNKTDARTAAFVLAHELGHTLLSCSDADHKYQARERPRSHLMHRYSDYGGTRIPKDDVNTMNRGGWLLPP